MTQPKFVVWHNHGYDLENTIEDAYQAAHGIEDSDYGSLYCIERPDGTLVDPDDYRQWVKTREVQQRQRRQMDPPRPPAANLTIKRPGDDTGVYEQQLYGDWETEHQNAVNQFGEDRVTIEIYEPATLCWRGTYTRRKKINFEQKKINDSRQAFNKPILTPDTTYEDEYAFNKVWHRGPITEAQIAAKTGFGRPSHDIEVHGTNRQAVEQLLRETATTWNAINQEDAQ